MGRAVDPPAPRVGAVSGRCDEGGVALPVLLLLMLALSVLAHGILLLARDTRRSARVWSAVAQGRVAAEVGVREAVAGWRGWAGLRPALWSDRVVVGGELGPRARYHVRLRTLGPEFRLLEGEGTVDGEWVSVRVGRVVWLLDPVARLGSARAAVEAGGPIRVEMGADVSGGEVSRAPAEWPAGLCWPYRQALDSLFPVGRMPPTAPLPAGHGLAPGLGLLSADTLAARADILLPAGARAHPKPDVVEGACRPGPLNWGRPDDPSEPCGHHLPLVAGEGSLVVAGGQGQGILVVAGDLRVTGGARFHGVVLVAGDLEVGDASRIEGLVRAAGTVTVHTGGFVVGRGCVVLRALEAASTLRGPVAPPDGSWLSPL